MVANTFWAYRWPSMFVLLCHKESLNLILYHFYAFAFVPVLYLHVSVLKTTANIFINAFLPIFSLTSLTFPMLHFQLIFYTINYLITLFLLKFVLWLVFAYLFYFIYWSHSAIQWSGTYYVAQACFKLPTHQLLFPKGCGCPCTAMLSCLGSYFLPGHAFSPLLLIADTTYSQFYVLVSL